MKIFKSQLIIYRSSSFFFGFLVLLGLVGFEPRGGLVGRAAVGFRVVGDLFGRLVRGKRIFTAAFGVSAQLPSKKTSRLSSTPVANPSPARRSAFTASGASTAAIGDALSAASTLTRTIRNTRTLAKSAPAPPTVVACCSANRRPAIPAPSTCSPKPRMAKAISPAPAPATGSPAPATCGLPPAIRTASTSSRRRKPMPPARSPASRYAPPSARPAR